MTDASRPAEEDSVLRSTEGYVSAFLALEEDNSAPPLEDYLQRVPAADRDECRQQILAAARIRGALTDLRALARDGPPPFPGDGARPVIPGFRIEAEIGRGGVGTVYSAWDETLERRVALKVLRHGTDAELRRRILHEARRAAGLNDPGIVTIHAVVDGMEDSAIVMEYVAGDPIDRAASSLRYRERGVLLKRLARSLALAHRRGVIHRDLKPANVLVTSDRQTKILDFGLAIPSDAAKRGSGAFAGTPLYASPEQIRGEPLTPLADVFSFGAVMYAVLTGRAPFDAKGVQEVFAKTVAAEPAFPRSLSPRVPEDLQAICLACLAADPEARPSADAVATDLGRFLAGQPVLLRPALYGDILRRRLAEHTTELADWVQQGMVSGRERDRLELVYRRVLADEDHWIVDARRLTLPQTLLYTGAWIVVVAAVLLVWLGRDEFSSTTRWLAPLAGCLVLLVVGLRAQKRRDLLASASFLAGAVLTAVPAVLSLLGEIQLFAEAPPGVVQLLDPRFTNRQIFAAAFLGLALSLATLWRLQMTGFAWTSAVLLTTSYWAFLLTQNLLGQRAEIRALWFLPLVTLELAALLSERVGRVRWALPFHLVALIVLVVALDVIALEGPTLALLSLTGNPPENAGTFFNLERQKGFSLALNGVLFVLLMIFMERSRSLDLRRGSQILEILAPLHLLGALYGNAQTQRELPTVTVDVAVYLGAVIAVLLLGPWRGRRRFLMGGLAGIALGSHLLIDLDLVSRAPFLLSLGVAGLALAGGTYIYLLIRTSERPQ